MPRDGGTQEEALRQFSGSNAGEGSEDEDLALAKVLQEQEQLFLRLRGSMQRSQANTDVDARNQDTASTSSTDSIGASMLNRFQALQSSTASGSVASDAEATTSPSEESGHDADMEFARQLQEEEDKIHYERMLQMAGIGTADEDPYLSDDSVDPDEMSYEQLQALGDTVGVVSRAAAHDIMDSLHKTSYAQHQPDHNQESCTEQCTVCCMEFEAADEVCVLGCNHCYHTSCIAQWLKHSKECPICHKEVTPAGSVQSTVLVKPASANRLHRKAAAKA